MFASSNPQAVCGSLASTYLAGALATSIPVVTAAQRLCLSWNFFPSCFFLFPVVRSPPPPILVRQGPPSPKLDGEHSKCLLTYSDFLHQEFGDAKGRDNDSMKATRDQLKVSVSGRDSSRRDMLRFQTCCLISGQCSRWP